MSEKKPDSARTEIISSDDLDYPLDVPTSGETATSAFPAASMAYGEPRSGMDPLAPLPFGTDPVADPQQPSSEDGLPSRGTTDFALFVLRLAVGVLLGLRGLQKLFGLFDGPGIDEFSKLLSGAGFQYADAFAIAGGAVELVAAVALIVGLATPAAAAALLGIVGLGVAIQLGGEAMPPLLGDTTKGLDVTVLYMAALVAILFAGPGRWSADRRWRWSYRPRFSGFVWLIVAIAAGVALWYFFNGTNPLDAASRDTPVVAR